MYIAKSFSFVSFISMTKNAWGIINLVLNCICSEWGIGCCLTPSEQHFFQTYHATFRWEPTTGHDSESFHAGSFQDTDTWLRCRNVFILHLLYSMHSFGFSCKYFVNRHHQHLRMTKSIEYSLLSLTTISKKKKITTALTTYLKHHVHVQYCYYS